MFNGRRLPVYGGLGVTSSCRHCWLVPGVLVSRGLRCDVADDLLGVVVFVVDSLLLMLFGVISLFTQQTHSYHDGGLILYVCSMRVWKCWQVVVIFGKLTTWEGLGCTIYRFVLWIRGRQTSENRTKGAWDDQSLNVKFDWSFGKNKETGWNPSDGAIMWYGGAKCQLVSAIGGRSTRW